MQSSTSVQCVVGIRLEEVSLFRRVWRNIFRVPHSSEENEASNGRLVSLRSESEFIRLVVSNGPPKLLFNCVSHLIGSDFLGNVF